MEYPSKTQLKYTPKVEPIHDSPVFNPPKETFAEKEQKKVEEIGVNKDAVENYKFYSLYSYFGLHDPDEATKTKVEFIHSFLYGKDGDTTEILWNLKKISDNLGFPEMGVSKLDHIYSYIRLLKDRKELEQRIQIMER